MTALLDVNVLVSLAWPNHVHHAGARAWFSTAQTAGWATCPVTQSGFIRVSSNRRVIPEARTPAEAADVLRSLCAAGGHEFWPDDVGLASSSEVDLATLAGYRQVTAAHLLALASRRDERLVTFDRALGELAAANSIEVELLA